MSKTEDAEIATIGATIISYNSSRWLPGAVERMGYTPGVELVIVDNDSLDGSAATARQAGAMVREMPVNRGYATACNVGIATMSRAHDWYAFVNPDVAITGHDLLKCAREAPEAVGCITPTLVDAEGIPTTDLVRPEERALPVVLMYLLSHRADLRVRVLREAFQRDRDRHFIVPATSGACLLVRGEVLREIGGWRNDYFYCGEDLDLCLRIRRAGHDIAIDRHITAVHAKGTSSADVGSVAKMFECGRARIQYFQLNGTPLHTLVVGCAILTGIVLRCEYRRVIGTNAEYRLVRRHYKKMVTSTLATIRRSWRKTRTVVPAYPLFLQLRPEQLPTTHHPQS